MDITTMFTEIEVLEKEANSVKDPGEKRKMLEMIGDLRLGLQEVSETHVSSDSARKIRKKRA